VASTDSTRPHRNYLDLDAAEDDTPDLVHPAKTATSPRQDKPKGGYR
jgi:hypothetical protein